MIIGEAASHLPPEMTGTAPDISWRGIKATRNVLVYAYFRVDLDLVWTVVEEDLEPLRAFVANLLDPQDERPSDATEPADGTH